MTAPTIAMATMIAAPTAKTYVSVIDLAVSAIGVAEACGTSSTCIAVSANELPYELEPAKDAIIVYFPGMSGCHA